MCTIAILIEVVANAPIVIAANRDELYARPTRPPERLRSGPHPIVGGVDVLSGGTWLAIRSDGRFAAVTNQRVLAAPAVGLRSRGLAVLELAAAPDPDAYVAAIDPAVYASMNLVWRGNRGVTVAYVRNDPRMVEVEDLPRGVHVLCNDRLDAPGFPRGTRVRTSIETLLDQGATWPALAAQLARTLGDHTRSSLVDTPPSQLAPPLARALTAACIHSEHYGTRSATIAAFARDRVIDYLHADGPPCVTPFTDRGSLIG